MSPAPTEETHAAVHLPRDVWEWVGWMVKALITLCIGWVGVIVKDVRDLKTWRTTQSALADMRDQQRTEILTIVKETRGDVKEIRDDYGRRIATLEGINEGRDH